MQKANNRNRTKKSRGQRRDNIRTQFASPSYGMKDQQKVRATLSAYVALGTLTGTNGFNVAVNWPYFQGGQNYNDVYRYFEVTGWRLDITFPTVLATTDSFYNGAAAIYPVNYLIDGLDFTLPTDPRNVLNLPGAVNVKEGQPNVGRWFPPPTKQVYPTTSFVSGGTRTACTIIGYFYDVGLNETAAIAEIYVDVLFYGARYEAANVNSVLKVVGGKVVDPRLKDSDSEDEDSMTVVTTKSTKKKK